MTGNTRNVWYLAVVVAVLLAGPRFGLAWVSAYDLCEEVCSEEAGCNDPCFPEPETGLITCGDYDGGYENGWCNPYNCATACGDGMCDSQFCGESITGSTCCTDDCGGVCDYIDECVKNSDCGSLCCNAQNECVDCSPPEPEGSPICNGDCEDDTDCCNANEICRGHPLLGGKCVTVGQTVCPDAPSCGSSGWCNGNVPECYTDPDGCYCSPSIERCLFLTNSDCPEPPFLEGALSRALLCEASSR